LSPAYSFRPIEPDDQELLFRIYASTRVEEMAQVNWSDQEKEAFLRMQFNAQTQHYGKAYSGDVSFQLILIGEQPVGRLYLHRTDEEIRIVDISLLPESRGQGIGSAILKELLAEAAAAGKPVRIHVERNNPALKLYERLGFYRIGDTGIYYLMEAT
jgi:ribosomal protein S18 acetylase RimI-like enzyme